MSNIVLEYQNKFDIMFTTSLRNKFTKMKYQLLVTKRVNDNLLKQNLILERKGTGNEQYIGDNA